MTTLWSKSVVGLFLCLLTFSAAVECNVSYDEYGQPHADRTLYMCAQVMQDPKSPVTAIKRYENESLVVLAQFVLNNLIRIDEIENTAELDFYLRYFWVDTRWKVPGLWDEMSDFVKSDGLEILPLVVADDPLPIWLPDIDFTERVSMEVASAGLNLKPGGRLFWSQHVILRVLQPNFDLHDYPLDSQHIVLKFGSYSFSTQVLKLGFKSPAVEYVVEPSDGEINFQKNPIWYHEKYDITADIYISDYTTDPESPKYYQELELSLNIERQAEGTMTRFALPILMLLFLAGLTFWASFDSRVETTMTILLSVSALYVVIIGNIPQLGYLTTFDTWIFTMFITLVVCVCGHQMVLVIQRKGESWPMRQAMTRMIEMAGRVVLIPFTMIMYWETFVLNPSPGMLAGFYIGTLVIALALFAREIGGVRKALRIAIQMVSDKIDSGKDHRLSKFELGMFNFFAFGVFNRTTKPYRQRKKRRARAKLEVEMQRKDGPAESGVTKNEMHDFRPSAEPEGKTSFREQAGDLADSDDDSD